MNKIIESDRLIIREFEKYDFMSLYKIESNEKMLKYLPRYKKSNYKECKRKIARLIDSYGKKKLNSWAICIKDSQEVIGITQLAYSSKVGGVEIGTKILPEYWGCGYASELTRALLEYGLNKLGLEEIIAVTDANNHGAIKSLINSGMTFMKDGYYNGAKSVFYSKMKN